MPRRLVKIFICSLLLIFSTSTINAQSSKSTDEETKIVPEYTYRQAFLTLRKDSVYSRNEHTNNIDQLYLSLKFVKTYNFIDEILLEPVIRTKRNSPTEIETVIDQAYISTSMGDSFQLTAGKYLDMAGTGFIINPSDLQNEDKNIFDPFYQREGKTLTQFAWTKDLHSILIGYRPKRGQDAEDGTAFAKLSSELFNIKGQVQYTYNKYDTSTFGLNLARFFGEHVELHFDGRYQLKQRSEDNHRERPFSEKYEHDDASGFFLAGTRFIITPKRTLILEGIHQQSGLVKDEINAFLKYEESVAETQKPTPQTRIIGRNYVFLGYRDEDTIPRTQILLSALYNLEDQSAFASLETKYTFSPIINLSVTPTFNTGKKYTEFGEAFASAIYYVSLSGAF